MRIDTTIAAFNAHSLRFAMYGVALLPVVFFPGCSMPSIEAPAAVAEFDVDFEQVPVAITEPLPVSEAEAPPAPYPHRTNPFLAPAQGEGGQAESVHLKGFVYVDQPKAILSIDGKTSIVVEQQELRGLKVISINPPLVTLQQGELRRQLALSSK